MGNSDCKVCEGERSRGIHSCNMYVLAIEKSDEIFKKCIPRNRFVWAKMNYFISNINKLDLFRYSSNIGIPNRFLILHNDPSDNFIHLNQ